VLEQKRAQRNRRRSRRSNAACLSASASTAVSAEGLYILWGTSRMCRCGFFMGERRKLPDDSETREMAVPDFAGDGCSAVQVFVCRAADGSRTK